ncbi:MAG: ferredoxin-type protein NapG [Deltaproteobacteria bacterium]|nr:ferredoxin-type protein NapG [Deltaproteobacteria bacterium]
MHERDEKPKPVSSRRKFLFQMVRSLGMAGITGTAWGAYVEENKADPLILRPPGAPPEEDFLKQCIKCGKCVEACPYDTLRLAAPGDQKPLGTPYFVPRETPCRMCTDIPCVPVCPTGALDLDRVSKNRGNMEIPDIARARMGVAVLDESSCLAYWGIQCDACYRACPLMDKALTIDYLRNARTGEHALLIPKVHCEQCTGCGVCEHVCITQKASVRIFPRDRVMGKADPRYIKGWDKRDERRLLNIPDRFTIRTERSRRKAQDYLNDEGILYE